MKLKVLFKRYILVTFIICIAVFMILSITGYYVCGKNIDIANNLISAFMDMADDSGLIKDDGQISVVALFLNNLRATGMAVVLGIVPFFFLPAIVLLSNGAIMGSAFAVIGQHSDNLLAYFIGGILPHGIFEIPAICLGISMGIIVCLFICQKILDKGKLSHIRAGEFFKNIGKLFLFVAVPLLMIAAVVETYITPVIMNALI